MNSKSSGSLVSVRMFASTRRRLKVEAAKRGVTIPTLIDTLVFASGLSFRDNDANSRLFIVLLVPYAAFGLYGER